MEDREASLRGQVEIMKYTYGIVDFMVLKCAVELQIADIINSYGRPITLSEIAAKISGTSWPDIPWLLRIMKFLVRRGIFSMSEDGSGGEPLYGLTHSSRYLLQPGDTAPRNPTLAPFILMVGHPAMMSPWDHMSDCVRNGGSAFHRAHGRGMYEFASQDGRFNEMFNDSMKCTAAIVMEVVLEVYREGFCRLISLVDVGGGTGGTLSEVLKSHPHIKGINFDLPHVVAAAPEYPGICHVGGDMFESIPSADAVFMRWILHNWSDEDCVKILKNCRKAIPKESGKVIIVDVVLEPHGDSLFDDISICLDLTMGIYTTGKERSESEWKKILIEAGFSRFSIIKTKVLHSNSIIQAYPD